MKYIVYVCPSFLIADKPHNLPTVPLKNSQDTETLLSAVSDEYPEILQIKGRNPWEGGAVHRLDTATSGLVVFARTQSFYDHIIQLQQNGEFEKTYIATTGKAQKIFSETVSSYFRSYGPGRKKVKAEKSIEKADSPVLYSTRIKVLQNNQNSSVFECKITRGFRHQIRVHLASAGYPILGDSLYNSLYENKKEDLLLTCTSLSFKLENGQIFNYRIQ